MTLSPAHYEAILQHHTVGSRVAPWGNGDGPGTDVAPRSGEAAPGDADDRAARRLLDDPLSGRDRR